MENLAYSNRQEVYEGLLFRLTEEPALKAALWANPQAVLAETLGLQMPTGVELRVVEDTALQHHVVIPWLPAAAQARDPADEEEAVVQRALQDAGFRQRLLAHPKDALAELFGFCLPAGAEITVLEETPQTWYFVCPPQIELAADELDDGELEAVAGGASSSTCDTGGTGGACNPTPGTEIKVARKTASSSARSRRVRRARYPICH